MLNSLLNAKAHSHQFGFTQQPRGKLYASRNTIFHQYRPQDFIFFNISCVKTHHGNCLFVLEYDNSVMGANIYQRTLEEKQCSEKDVSHSSLKLHRMCCDIPDMWEIMRRCKNDRKQPFEEWRTYALSAPARNKATK